MQEDRPHRQHEHLFGIVRIDVRLLPGQDADPAAFEHAVAGTRAFRSKADADRDAKRLNTLNADKPCRYLVVYLRCVDSPAEEGDGPLVDDPSWSR